MTVLRAYVVYDVKRDRTAAEWECVSDDVAIREFGLWYNAMVRNWERRALDRYALFRGGVLVDDVEVSEEDTLIFMDWQVRLSYNRFRMNDPPSCAADEVALDAEFGRLNAIDEARIARRSNSAGDRDAVA